MKGKVEVVHLEPGADGKKLEYQVSELNPLEFIESPQWLTRCNANDDQSFIGTIRAIENSRYLMWPLENLDAIIEKNPHFRAYIDSVIGVDVAHKMLRMESRLHDTKNRGESCEFTFLFLLQCKLSISPSW
jgi:hypothetical protein